MGNRGKLRHSSFANGDLDLAKDVFGMPPLSPIFRGCMQGHENGGKINSFGDCLPIFKFFPGENTTFWNVRATWGHVRGLVGYPALALNS